MRFVVLAAAKMALLFCALAPYGFVGIYRRFGGTYESLYSFIYESTWRRNPDKQHRHVF